MSLFEMTAEDYLKEVQGWEDPNPAPEIVEHDGFLVVRDDMLGYGSKVRGLDYMIGHSPEFASINEWCFGACPAVGYAQISLPYLCNRYGKEAHLFMAKRNMDKLHPNQKRGLELGAKYHWIDNGMLNVTKARCRDYVAEDPEHRACLPLGLEHPTVIGSLIKVARGLSVKPDHVWSVGSSGTINRSLQLAWPDAECFVVGVGHGMNEREIGRATYLRSPYKFDRPVKPEDTPPYPSVAEYDAKLWSVVRDYYTENEKPPIVVLWNVA
jgi:hypothetical protein